MIRQPTAHLPALTSLRFFAAALVVFFHYLPRVDTDTSWWLRIVNHGYVGVSFFFVLSGFILAYTGAGADYGVKTVRRAFYARRLARIYPAFLLAMLLDWPLFAWFQHTTLPWFDCVLRVALVTGLTLTLVHAWFPWALGQLNAPGWTIGVEMFLYASLPRLMQAVRHLSISGRWVWTSLALGLCWVPAMVEPWTENWFPESNTLPVWLHSPYPAASTWIGCFPPFHLAQFFVGVVAGRWVTERVGQRSSESACGLVVAAILMFIGAALMVQRGAWPLFDSALNHGALAGGFAVLFAALALAPHARWLLPLNWWPLVVLGDASYALYIFQMPVMKWINLGFTKAGVPHEEMTRFFVGFVTLVSVSLASWKFEQWARPRLAAWLTPRLGGCAT